MTLDFGHIKLTGRPLVVCDIDEVVLEFITPLRNFLRSEGYDLLARSFRLTGNVVSAKTGDAESEEVVKALLEAFFQAQDSWQTPAPKAVETLARLSGEADLIFLTAMPPRHALIRRALLDRFDLYYPLLATEGPKGPVIKALLANMTVACAFIDDIAHNLLSVKEHVPECLLINLMANSDFRLMAPPLAPGVLQAEDWEEVEHLIRSQLFVTQ